MKKAISVLLDILIAIICVFTSIFGISTAKRGYANFCGYSIVQVLSNSMNNSGITRGDVKMIQESSNYEVGDIIAFHYNNGNEELILYHQIIEITEKGEFVTKGSSNNLPEAHTITQDNIIGKQVNNGNYKLLVSFPFKLSLILISYIITMSYLIYTLQEIIKDDKTSKFTNIKVSKSIIGIIIGTILIPCYLLTNQVLAAQEDNMLTDNHIRFIYRSWQGSEELDKDGYKSVLDLEYALNNPISESGKAFTTAINARKSADWVGNIDTISNVCDNLDKVMSVPEGCTYIIKIKSSTRYELYLTYEDYSNLDIYTRFGIVYKTIYELSSNGKYDIKSSELGSATVTYYDAKHNQMQKSFNTDEFIAY